MKKLYWFIVEKHKIILITALVLILLSGAAIFFVNINYDLTKYLPDDSGVKTGMTIMDSEFGEASAINIMFKGLDEKSRDELIEEIKSIKHVSGVTYEADNPKYNKDGNTLFIINLSVNSYSEEASATLSELESKFDGSHEFYTSGVIVDNKYTGVGTTTLIIALTLLLIILFILSKSWIEPLLFLIVIGAAVVLNSGTNIIFNDISSLTNSIAAILQLVLSMDYSIMLIDRYRQEKELVSDKKEAMKNALSKGFLAIAGSSVTTIVGLVCLVFMSFTIGVDMGLVLAKGVFFSLLCILFLMPGLIILFDGLLEKTKKKNPVLKMNKVAELGYKGRYVILVVFVLLFVGGFILNNFVLIEYSISTRNPGDEVINEVFPSENQLILIYDNKDEDKIDSLIKIAENNKYVNSISGYTNTIGNEFDPSVMSGLMDEKYINFLIYSYYNKESDIKLTIPEIIGFLSDNDFSDFLDDEMKSQIEMFSAFSDPSLLSAPMSAAEIASILDMEQEVVEPLIMYYYMQNDEADAGKMTLSEFVGFIYAMFTENDQLGNIFDEKMMESFELLALLSDKDFLNAKQTPAGMSELLNIDRQMTEQLFYAYNNGQTNDSEISISEFIPYLLSIAESNSDIASMFDEEALMKLHLFNNIITSVLTDENLSTSGMAQLTGASEADLRTVYLYYQSMSGNTDDWKISLKEFVAFLIDDISENEDFAGMFDEDDLNSIIMLRAIIDSIIAETEYGYTEIAALLGTESEMMEFLFLFYQSIDKPEDNKISTYDFIMYLANDIANDSRFESFLDNETKEMLTSTAAAMEEGKNSLKGKNYSRLIISTGFDEESEEVYEFIDSLGNELENGNGEFYFIGNSAIANEMSKSFKSELNMISIITAAAIFIVVLFTFRSFAIPIILVLLIQCAVFLTTSVAYLQGIGTYYLALIIVQAILMGATIDYAILYTEYYRSLRGSSNNILASLKGAFSGSIMTILTSSSILCGITFIIGMFVKDPTTSQVCLTIAKGCLIAVILVILVLPSLLAVFDRFVTKKSKKQ